MNKCPYRIAVVDDEESVVRALHRLLRSADYVVDGYNQGQTFLDSLTDHPYDCVLLDLHMPLMNGFEVQARLTQARPHTPMIIITGHDTPESHRLAMDGGASAYLRKPVDGPTLLDTIEKLVEGQPKPDSHPAAS
ncbi:MAG: response regulator [Phycisphaeraceae bacterium]|nr:response regulator [Phycisphaeraceae bacterium]